MIRYFADPLPNGRAQMVADVLDGDGAVSLTYEVGSPAPRATVEHCVETMNGRPRKAHVRVSQDEILDALRKVEVPAELATVAEHFEISEASARRKLDGLVAQGKVRRIRDRGPLGPEYEAVQ